MIQRDDTQGNWSEREIIESGALGRFPTLMSALKVWKWKATKGRVNASDWLSDDDQTLVDTVSENPAKYSFIHYGGQYKNADRMLSGLPVLKFPVERLAYDALGEYHLCRETGKPSIYHVNHARDGIVRNALRLILPLSGRSGLIERVCIVHEHLEPPHVPCGIFTPASSSS